MVDIMKFENKRLIEALKIEKQKRNVSKQLNLLGKKDNGLQLFLSSCMCVAQEFATQKKVEKKQYKTDIKKKKE